jgi:hypothetical protein
MSELDPSKGAPIKPRNQCVAHKKTGERCQKAPIMGATVCRFHGGAAPHVKRAAKARLENAADRMAAMLLGIALDETIKPETRLAAIKDALDRAGLNPRQALDVTHDIPRYQKMFNSLDRSLGDTPAPNIIDGEIVDADAYVEFGDGREP